MPLAQAGQPITAAILNRQYTPADGSNTTVTGTSLTALSTVYTVPASDAAAFTCYRLTAWGTGTWGSTQRVLTLGMALAGTTIGGTPSISATALAASAAFSWRAAVTLMCVSTGTSGTWSAELSGIIAETANAELPGTPADNVVPFAAVTATDVTQDTTVAVTLAILAGWANTTPSITCTNTMFERLAV